MRVASACANAFTPPALLAARKKSPAWKVAEVLEVRSPRWLTCDPQGATSRWLLTCLTAWRGVSPGRCRRYSAANVVAGVTTTDFSLREPIAAMNSVFFDVPIRPPETSTMNVAGRHVTLKEKPPMTLVRIRPDVSSSRS